MAGQTTSLWVGHLLHLPPGLGLLSAGTNTVMETKATWKQLCCSQVSSCFCGQHGQSCCNIWGACISAAGTVSCGLLHSLLSTA